MRNLNNPKIFVVEDDIISNELCSQNLRNNGYVDVSSMYSGRECLSKLHELPDIVVLDYQLGDITGVEILKQIKSIDPDTHVIFLSGQDNLGAAVDTLKLGAFDYLNKKDSTGDKLLQTLHEVKKIEEVIDKQKSVKRYKNAFLMATGAAMLLYIIGLVV